MKHEQSNASVLDGYLDPEELAAQIHRSVRTLARWREQGDGPPYVLIGKSPIYSIDGARNWLKEREIKPVRT